MAATDGISYASETAPGLLPDLVELLGLQGRRPDNLLLIQEQEYYAGFTADRGMFVTARSGSRLVGYQLLAYTPAIHPLWLPYIERLQSTPDQCSVSTQILVHPELRRSGIGRALRQRSVAHLRARGTRYNLATTHPDNRANLGLLQSVGYHELDRAIVYTRRVPRVLLYLDLLRAAG